MSELYTEFGFIWQPKTSMVYPALRKLKNRGLIRENKEKSDEITNVGTYYELTEKGLQELKKFQRPFHPPLPFFQGRKFKPLSTPFKRFHFWEKFVDFETMIEHLMTYREHLMKELERIDKKVRELKEKKEYQEALQDIDIQ